MLTSSYSIVEDVQFDREKFRTYATISEMLMILVIVFVSGRVCGDGENSGNLQNTNIKLEEALQFLREYDLEASNMCFRVSSAQWTYSTNMTDFNKRRMIEEQVLKAKFDKVTWRKAVEFDWTRIPDPMVRRQLKMMIIRDRASLSDEKYNEIHHLISEMKDIYAHVRICPYVPDPFSKEIIYCDLELGDVQRIIATSRDNRELLHAWREWHDKTGPPMRNKFMRYVDLANQAAVLNEPLACYSINHGSIWIFGHRERIIRERHIAKSKKRKSNPNPKNLSWTKDRRGKVIMEIKGFAHAGEEMDFVYESADFQDELAESFQKILPLYKELFAYVRSRLYRKYGPEVIRPDGPLPAHILGNLWAQEWTKIYDIVAPYPEFGIIDVSNEMLQQGFTPLRMFQMAEEFFTSLGLKPMPPEFWRFSMIEKPNSRKVQCTASAWDFCNRIDYRIKQCTEVNMENLITTHHEMAHIEYYLYYADQPYLYRDGANPGFHEGVANAIVLSIINPDHLYRMGLTGNNSKVYERNINFLMLMALKKVAYAPFAYLVDQWRNQMFEYGVTRMNSDWWNLRLRYQGIVPPVPRSEGHFDAASKRHIPADVPYVKYYVALLLEFQIYKATCTAAGHKGPLHTCDIYRSREAGRVLSDIFRVGKARHWKDVIKMLSRGKTGKLSADPLIEYFEPLMIWLQSANKDEPVIGWMTSKQDIALYQPLLAGAKGCTCTLNLIYSVIVFYCILKLF